MAWGLGSCRFKGIELRASHEHRAHACLFVASVCFVWIERHSHNMWSQHGQRSTPTRAATVPYFDSFVLRNFSADSPIEGKSSFAMEMSEMRCVQGVCRGGKNLLFLLMYRVDQ